MHAIAELVAEAMPDVVVDVGFLEMTDPPAGEVLDDLVARGARRVVILPLVLLGAGHAKSDVPVVAVEGRRRHPGVELTFGSPLGVSAELVGVLGDAVVDAGGRGLPLLVVARGTSDPDANGDVFKIGRLLGEWTAAPFVQVGFTGLTAPLVPDAAAVLERLGFDRIAVAWWFLCHGKLVERARGELASFRAGAGVELLDVGHVGASGALVDLVRRRHVEALAGGAKVNCDTCAYRSAWPGLEDRVGQAVGVGHSHLASEHLHHSAVEHSHR